MTMNDSQPPKPSHKDMTLSEIEKGLLHWIDEGPYLMASKTVLVPLLDRAMRVYVHRELEEVSQTQLEALREFLRLGRDTREEIAIALALDCHTEVVLEYEDRIESLVDPQHPEDVWRLIDLRKLTIPRHGESTNRYVCVSGECKWEVEHGLTLVFRNGRLIDVTHCPPLEGNWVLDCVGRFDNVPSSVSETGSESEQSASPSKTAHTRAELDHESGSKVRALIELLQDESPSVRSQAASGLARMSPPPEVAVPALVELLRDPDASVRDAAARALGRIGPEARAAIPVLFELASENDSWACEMIDYFVRRIGSAAIPVLTELLQDEKPTIRVTAAHALVRIDPSTVTPLVDLLCDEDPAVWVEAAVALTALGKAAMPALAQLLEHEKARVRAAAAAALGRI